MESDCPLCNERTELRKATSMFEGEMIRKLIKKADAGFRGWNNNKVITREELIEKLKKHVNNLDKSEKEEVDIANFAMMLWYRREMGLDNIKT